MLRPLPLVLVLAACGGSTNPPPPVATATPSRTADDLGPLSSRDAKASPAPGAAAAPAGADATLPPGHPPIGGAADPHGAGAPDPHGNVAGAGPTKSAGSVTGTITLAPKLQASPSDVLYIIAKKGGSTLAVRRVEKPSFPFAFEIGGGDAMMTGVAFEGPLDVVARVSRTGDAIPAKGDLEGTAKSVKVPSKDVKLTIDSVRQ
jgi:hypothetical protein